MLIICSTAKLCPGYTDVTVGQQHLFVIPGFRESTAGGLGVEGQFEIHSEFMVILSTL